MKRSTLFILIVISVLTAYDYFDLILWIRDNPNVEVFITALTMITGTILYIFWCEHVDHKHDNRDLTAPSSRGFEFWLRKKGFLVDRRKRGVRYYV